MSDTCYLVIDGMLTNPGRMALGATTQSYCVERYRTVMPC